MGHRNINFISLFSLLICVHPIQCHPVIGDTSSFPVPTAAGPTIPFSTQTNQMTPLLRRFYRAAGTSLAITEPLTTKAIFQKYYDCIWANHYKAREPPRAAILTQEGLEAELFCNVCLRPDQDPNRSIIEWRRFQVRLGEEGPIPHNPKRFIFTQAKSLLITNIDVLDAGLYACLRNGEPQNFYQIDVLFKEPRRVIYEDKGDKPVPQVKLIDRNLLVFTTWSDWSQCNRCGEEGLRRKIGLCTVKKVYNYNPVAPEDIPNMKYYPNGVPCRSTMLPRSVATLPQIRDRMSETMMGSCMVPCPTVAEVRTVTDSSGNVIKEIEVQYFSLNEKPKLPEMPKRDVMYKDAGRHLILTCPIGRDGKKKEDMIRWQNGTAVINSETIRRATRGRVRIDHHSRLLIRRLKVTDTAAFNCWLGGRHMATIKVIVTKPMNKDIKTYISYAGCGITVLAVVIIASSLCCKRTTKTAK